MQQRPEQPINCQATVLSDFVDFTLLSSYFLSLSGSILTEHCGRATAVGLLSNDITFDIDILLAGSS